MFRWLGTSSFVLATSLAVAVAGCAPPGSASRKTADKKNDKTQGNKSSPRPGRKEGSRGRAKQNQERFGGNTATPPGSSADKDRRPEKVGSQRTLADLVQKDGGDVFQGAFPDVNDEKTKAAGLRKLAGKHVTIYTDLPSQPAVDELPRVFDLAIPQWTEYFKLDKAKVAKFHLIGSIMKDRKRFEQAGLYTANLPTFPNGYNLADRFWLYEQPSDYYRRHLMLHEGTHGFMQHFLRGSGPPWYSEGMAELFGTHRWQNGKLQMRYMPADKTETPYWGRIKIVKEDLADNKARTMLAVFSANQSHRNVNDYGWCWAVAAFLDNHPDFRGVFRALGPHAAETSSRFSQAFFQQLRQINSVPQRPSFDVFQQYQWYVYNLDYGFDIQREAIQQKARRQLPVAGTEITVAVDRGWQSTGIEIQPGRYIISAKGRYQINNQPKIWWCEPGGVTIRYHRGHPLGMLMAAVAPEVLKKGTTPLARPEPIGVGREVTFSRPGTLFLRINDSPSDLANNKGSLAVSVRRATGPAGPN